MANLAGIIAIPTRGTVSTHFMMARAMLQGPLAISWADLVITDDLCIEKGFNPKSVAAKKQLAAEYAVEQGCEWVLFIDDDVLFPPNTLLKLLSWGKDIVNGVYWSKSDPSVPLVFKGHMQGSYYDWHVGDFIEIDSAGMGLTLIKTKVFKEMPKPWFSENYVYHQLDGAPSKNNATTEDLYFYKKARDFGFKVYCDTSLQAYHYDWMSKRFFGIGDAPQGQPASSFKATGNKLIADIGCGNSSPFFEEGNPIRMDIREDVKPDIVCDIRKIPEPDCKYDIIYSSNVLEHFSHRLSKEILNEWLRILKMGGEMRLIVPNIEYAARKIIEGEVDDYSLWILYGQQGYAKDFHAAGFTEILLRRLLENMDCLKDIRVEHIQGDRMLKATAIKIKHNSFESIDPQYDFKKNNQRKGDKYEKDYELLLENKTEERINPSGVAKRNKQGRFIRRGKK